MEHAYLACVCIERNIIYVWIGCDLTACITSAMRLQCRIERNKSWSRFWRRSYRWIHDFFFDESMMGKMKKTPNFLITIDEMMKTHWKLMRSFWKTLCVRCRLEPHNVTFFFFNDKNVCVRCSGGFRLKARNYFNCDFVCE